MMMFVRYHMILGLASSYPIIWYFLRKRWISMFADIIEQWDEYMIQDKY